ncbi:MAG: hypothetical protein RMI78_01625 [Nitrososphaerota archaeon]|nr:hypothetical protein [Nitrososphaerota archaeon]
MSRTKVTISSAMFLGALAALFATLPIYFHYPIIPYLRFEAAEIPVVLSFLILGPEAAFLSSVIYWVILLLVGEFTPIGPIMKFTALSTMILGLWLGFRICRSPRVCLIAGSCLGCLFRVLAMSAFNYVILMMMFPQFLEFAAASISAVLGAEFLSHIPAIAAVMVFTAIFNVLHVILSMVPAYLLVKYMVRIKGGGLPIIGKAWYFEMAKAVSKQSPQRS